MKASEIIASAVSTTVRKAYEAGMIQNEAEEQTAGKAALNMVMTSFPELWAAYQEEVIETLQAA